MVTVLLLAAGESRRYRAAAGCHKLLAAGPDGQPLFDVSLRRALALGLPVQAVTRPGSPLAARAKVHGCGVTQLASAGLAQSLAAGVAATPDAEGWLILLADMPIVRIETCRRVLAALGQYACVRPVYQGLPGHPVGWRADQREALLALGGEWGARQLMRHVGCHLLPVDDAGCVQDVDLPGDWQAISEGN